MMMNSMPAAPLLGIPFEPFSQTHVLTQRYSRRQLVDDVAGESVPADASHDDFVCVSDLPLPARVIRPGMSLPKGLLLPSDTLLFIVDDDSIITLVGCAEGRRSLA
ncbi:hypothetical protein GGH95_003595 [Coemansia sp. RSA 1836]|nr:hypothetical protein GGF38_004775 [Coemansia sp. RSA 25]KAJ2576853.1 hypothetical protein GGH95_003595 [Coemansia sp. RSA 1836]